MHSHFVVIHPYTHSIIHRIVHIFATSDHDRACQAPVARAGSDSDTMSSTRDLPALSDNIPEGKVVAGEREADSLGLAGRKVDAVEALKEVRR
jgi:hypothetical protein